MKTTKEKIKLIKLMVVCCIFSMREAAAPDNSFRPPYNPYFHPNPMPKAASFEKFPVKQRYSCAYISVRPLPPPSIDGPTREPADSKKIRVKEKPCKLHGLHGRPWAPASIDALALKSVNSKEFTVEALQQIAKDDLEKFTKNFAERFCECKKLIETYNRIHTVRSQGKRAVDIDDILKTIHCELVRYCAFFTDSLGKKGYNAIMTNIMSRANWCDNGTMNDFMLRKNSSCNAIMHGFMLRKNWLYFLSVLATGDVEDGRSVKNIAKQMIEDYDPLMAALYQSQIKTLDEFSNIAEGISMQLSKLELFASTKSS